MPSLIPRPRQLLIAVATAGAALAASSGAGALAATPTTAAVSDWCSNQALSQPFVAWGDQNYFTQVRGQNNSGFTGSGWALIGGAGVVSTQLADGTTGGVLDLPSGSTAISPPACVNSTFPDARMLIDDVTGDEGVEVYVSYKEADSFGPWSQPMDLGAVNGGQGAWALSDPVNLPAPPDDNWQLARFTFVAGGSTSEFQIYDFYLDPYSRG